MNILLLLIYPATLRGVIPRVLALVGEMVQELPAPTIFNGSNFHDLMSVVTHIRWYDETGDGGNCISG